MSEARFFDDGGLVWIDLWPEWAGFNEALNDGVSALSPRGEAPALSTFWIDSALAGASGSPGSEVASGNSTRIERTPTGVCALSDHGLFDIEEMSIDEFVRLLNAWRDEVLAQRAAGDLARPEQGSYQRNPPA